MAGSRQTNQNKHIKKPHALSTSTTLTEKQQKLVQLLRSGLTVVTPLWNYTTRDWVSSVQAADIDNDGDIEIIVGSRDGMVRALTKWGRKKWGVTFEHAQWVSSIAVITSAEGVTTQGVPRIIVGTRDGYVYALDQKGSILPDWQYQTTLPVRQIYINPAQPDRIIVGSEDHCVHVLDCASGEPLWSYRTEGWVQCVSSYDVDGDGEIEVLAGSNDKRISILSADGHLKGICETSYRIFSLGVALLPDRTGEVQPTILASNTGKDIAGWTVSAQTKHQLPLLCKKTWPSNEKNNLFQNRPYAIYVADINKDGLLEILVGTEDKHLYILDQQGKLLWKHFVGHCIYSIYAADINYDGLVEVIIGLDDNSVYVLRVDLIPHLYAEILDVHEKVQNAHSTAALIQSENVTMLWHDLIGRAEVLQPFGYMELHVAELERSQRDYEKALTIALMVERQHVQHYWPHPYGDLGHIRALSIGDLHKDPKDEVIVGNEEGEVIVLDIEQVKEKNAVVWRRKLPQRILTLQAGTTRHNEYDSILAVLADRRISVLNNKGVLRAQDELTFADKEDLIWSLFIDTKKDKKLNQINQIVFGLENNKIYIYDDHLKERLITIHTPRGIKVVHAFDINVDGEVEIIAGGTDNHVYVYMRDNTLLWEYATRGRIRAICVADVDEDGQVEILIGSEDRNVYVLDNQGQLKWRYYAPHRVLAVTAFDIDKDGKHEILLGVADGYMYVLNGQGDLLWRYQSNDRVRAVRAKDLNDDGQIEIVVASEDRLSLLQMVEPERVEELIRLCWNGLRDFDNPKETMRKYARRDDNEYLRAYALSRLSGQPGLTKEDFQILHDALQTSSVIVKIALVGVIINLCKRSKENPEVPEQIRQLLFQLFSEPNREIRLAIVNMLQELIKMDSTLGFDYLERFTLNVDIWVRRALVRKLYYLSETKLFNKQVFRLLRLTAQDEHPWIRQETGRSLAHFFDLHLRELISGTHELLEDGVDPLLIAQIASSAREPVVKQLHGAFAHLLQQLTESNATQLLTEAISALEQAHTLYLPCSETTLLFYRELQQLYKAHTVDMIEQQRRITSSDHVRELPRLTHLAQVLQKLEEVIDIFRMYRRREALGDRAASLVEATAMLDTISQALHMETWRLSQSLSLFSKGPEDSIVAMLLQRWRKIAVQELYRLRGQAELELELKNKILPNEENVVVTLAISNTGRCPADNVRITLQASEEYTIIDNAERFLEEVTMLRPIRLDFTIQTHTILPRLLFHVVYDDAEKLSKELTFAEKVAVQTLPNEQFREIPIPYRSGIPISDQAMFYGRQEDMLFLKEILTSNAANRVVTLTGQRRSGKTSLIYQLLNNSDWLSPHIPVFIDMQSLALKNNTQQFLLGFASAIHDTLSERGLSVPLFQSSDLDDDPTHAFGAYLERVTRQLGGVRLVLLIDEFEMLAQKIKDKELDQNLLPYLRNLMQHQPRLSFLLAGAPAMRRMTEDYLGVFFNIAHPHKLSKLNPQDARLLIIEPIQDYLEYDPLAVDKVRYLTGDQPYLIHIISETLIRYCNKQRKKYVTISDVNKMIEPVVEKGINYFGWIWNMSTPTERFILAILAQDRGDDNRVFSATDIEEEYGDYGIPFDREQVLEQLKHLVEGDIIEERVNGTQYRLPVGLIRAWLRQDKPPERVVREERLDQIMEPAMTIISDNV